MKTNFGKIIVFSFLFIALIFCFTGQGLAADQWICTQGSSGQLNDSTVWNNTLTPNLYYAWGMGYEQVPNATNWLIFPVTSIGLASVRYIVINLNAVLGGDIYVDRVAVWSGETKLVEDVTVNWSGNNIGWQFVDLGSLHTVTSLGISLRTRTGDFGGQLKVYSVCVNFTL